MLLVFNKIEDFVSIALETPSAKIFKYHADKQEPSHSFSIPEKNTWVDFKLLLCHDAYDCKFVCYKDAPDFAPIWDATEQIRDRFISVTELTSVKDYVVIGF